MSTDNDITTALAYHAAAYRAARDAARAAAAAYRAAADAATKEPKQ